MGGVCRGEGVTVWEVCVGGGGDSAGGVCRGEGVTVWEVCVGGRGGQCGRRV